MIFVYRKDRGLFAGSRYPSFELVGPDLKLQC